MFIECHKTQDYTLMSYIGGAATADLFAMVVARSCMRDGQGTSKLLMFWNVASLGAGTVPIYYWWGTFYDYDMLHRVYITWIALVIVRIAPVIGYLYASLTVIYTPTRH
jgi:hypothetical protein